MGKYNDPFVRSSAAILTLIPLLMSVLEKALSRSKKAGFVFYDEYACQYRDVMNM